MAGPTGWGMQLIGYAQEISLLKEIKEDFSNQVVYLVGTHVSYAIYPEFGAGNNPAQPYLRPALQEGKAKAAQIAATEDVDSVEELAEKVALFVEKRAAEKAPVDSGQLQASVVSAPADEFDSEAAQALSEAPGDEG